MTQGFYPGDDGFTNFFTEVQKGNVSGHRIDTVACANSGLQKDVIEDIWQGGDTFLYPTVGEQWEVLSDDTADTAIGVGAREITITYLDTNYDEQTEVVALNGVTPVLLVATDAFRTRTAAVTDAGNTVGNLGGAIGTITVQVAGGGDLRYVMTIGENRARNSHRTVPDGKTAYFIYWLATSGKDRDVFFRFRSTDGDSGIFVPSTVLSVYQETASVNPTAMIGPLIERSDMKLTGVVSNTGTPGEATYQLLVVDN